MLKVEEATTVVFHSKPLMRLSGKGAVAAGGSWLIIMEDVAMNKVAFLLKAKLYAVCIVLTTAVLILPEEASAVPAFARQTNMPCTACHYQHFPALNSFGRAFRASGYTMMGGQGLIEGDDISLPVVLNASVIAKLRYVTTNGNTNEDTDHSQIEWPDEAALLVGGHLAENVGFLMELGLGDVAVDDGAGNVSSNSFLSTKLHFNVGQAGGTQFSVIPFSTDGLGVGYGFELLNTGAQRSQRSIEDRRGFSAAQALGLGSGEATGIALVASSHNYFVNYSPWVPGWGGSNTSVEVNGLTHYLRAVFMPTIGGWDTGFGVQSWSGDATVAANDGFGGETEIVTSGWVVDAQAQGDVSDMPLGLYASYGKCDAEPGHFVSNCANVDDADAFGFLAQLGVLPNKANIYVAYRTMDIGTATDNKFNSVTVGGNYMVAQNIRLELFRVVESGSGVDAQVNERDTKTILQLFAGF